MKNHNKNVKIFFCIVVLCLGIFMVGGSFAFFTPTQAVEKRIVSDLSFFKNLLAFNSANRNQASSAISTLDNYSTINANKSVVEIPVLVYHGITKESDRFNFTVEDFRDHMFSLKKAGYRTISIQEYLDFINNEKTLDDKVFLLTFDDGRIDSYLGADPILRVLDYNAVMFIAPHFSLGEKRVNNYYLFKDELQEMEKSGRWDIESHAMQNDGGSVLISTTTRGNFLSNKKFLSQENRLETDNEYIERVKNELTDSKKAIEDFLNKKVVAFSYPFSDYGIQSINNRENAESVIADSVKNNYELAFQQVDKEDDDFTSNYIGDNPYHLHRIEAGTDWSGEYLINYLENARAKNLPYKDEIKKDNGWKKTWGTIAFNNDSLTLKSHASTTGAFAFLDGTKHWKDYLYTAEIDWSKGSHISLISHYIDSRNYIACTFSQGNVRVENYVDGIPTKLSETANFVIISTTTPVSLSMMVKNDYVECLVGNTVITFASISPRQGGIGFKVWDKEMNNSSIDIRSISVAGTEDMGNLRETLPVYARIPEKPVNAIDKPVSIQVEEEKSQLALPYILNTADLDTISKDKKSFGSWYSEPNKLSISDNALQLNTVTPNTTSYALLRSGTGWKDISFTADIGLGISSKITAVARYADSKNYISCEYADNGELVLLVEVRNGVRNFTGGVNDTSMSVSQAIREQKIIGINVVGTKASCLGQDGKVVYEADVPTMPTIGTVGFKVYAQAPGFASMKIKNATVSPL